MTSQSEKNRHHLATGIALALAGVLWKTLGLPGAVMIPALIVFGIVLVVRTLCVQTGIRIPINRETLKNATILCLSLALVGQAILLSRQDAQIREKDQTISDFFDEVMRLRRDRDQDREAPPDSSPETP